MNIRALIDWGLVYKEFKPGERREFFIAEKDIDQLARKIAKERSKREIKPAIRVLKEVIQIEESKPEAQSFKKQTKALYDFMLKADTMIDKITSQKENWITKTIFKIIK
jgi:DNA-binding transcriptional regulator GbsR (MarR family)